MSNKNRLCALVARRDFLTEWLADYTTKISNHTPLTLIEQCEYDYLVVKADELNAEISAARDRAVAKKRTQFSKLYVFV